MMLNVQGAFAATPGILSRCNHPDLPPPEKFVASHLSGGLKFLFQCLSKENTTGYQRHEPGSQTSEDGKFQPCYPVPLLAKRYKFTQVIGRGQSSVLISAEDCFHPDRKPVALKIMNLNYSKLGAQEAQCIQQLNKADGLHVSRTVQFLNKFTFDGHYCMVFELLRPRPLHQYFQRSQFDNEEAKLKVIRKIALQLLQALGFLKRQNVIHADLKPENILFEEGEEIKVKVVDFGNAIHCVRREVSLYYDEFELQTLLYRAPEVMFGVPFGTEIDMWSLGCILAELHSGKPLFLGRCKKEVLEEVIAVLGPVPRNPFQSGKFFQDFSEYVDEIPETKPLLIESNLMRKLHNSRNFPFASFLAGLLQHSPSERLTPSRAALHPFFAPDFPYGYLLPQQGEKIADVTDCYTNILITPQQYKFKPHIDKEITRQDFSAVDPQNREAREFSNSSVLTPSAVSPPLEKGIGSAPKRRQPCGGLSSLTSDVKTAKSSHANTELATEENRNKLDKASAENSRYASDGPPAIASNALSFEDKKLESERFCNSKGSNKFGESTVEKTDVSSSKQLYSVTVTPRNVGRVHLKQPKYNLRGDRSQDPSSSMLEWKRERTHSESTVEQRSHLEKSPVRDNTGAAARTRVYYRRTKSLQLEKPVRARSQATQRDLFDRFDNSTDRPGCTERSTEISGRYDRKKKVKRYAITSEQDSGNEDQRNKGDEEVVFLL